MENEETTTDVIDINEVLKESISRLSKQFKIPLTEFRLNISKPDRELICMVTQNLEDVEKIDLKDAVDLKNIKGLKLVPIILKQTMLRTKLINTLNYLALQNNTPLRTVDLRIYTKTEDCEPLGYLFINKKAIRKVGLDEILTIN